MRSWRHAHHGGMDLVCMYSSHNDLNFRMGGSSRGAYFLTYHLLVKLAGFTCWYPPPFSNCRCPKLLPDSPLINAVKRPAFHRSPADYVRPRKQNYFHYQLATALDKTFGSSTHCCLSTRFMAKENLLLFFRIKALSHGVEDSRVAEKL